jgi:hypothetical protein
LANPTLIGYWILRDVEGNFILIRENTERIFREELGDILNKTIKKE